MDSFEYPPDLLLLRFEDLTKINKFRLCVMWTHDQKNPIWFENEK